MPSIPNVSPKNAKGLIDKVVGVFEEVIGSLTSNDRLEKRGQLHQEAASKRLEALKHQVKATKEDAKATGAEQGQRSAQKAKESA